MFDSKIIQLPQIVDPRGNLSIIEPMKHCPFEFKRVHWIYDVPGGMDRGGHAYKETQEFIVALSGSFDVEIDDGIKKKVYPLNRSYYGLYVPKGLWRTMTNFSTNSLALVLSSTEYDSMDYVMDYDEFKLWRSDSTKVPRKSANTTSIKVNTPSEFFGQVGNGVFDCKLCELVKMHDKEGNLTYIYENAHVPFIIKRVFYSYDIPAGEDRGAHAHKRCHQFVVAASGSFEVALDDGTNQRIVQLNRPFWGLHVPPGIWAAEQGFSSGAICLVLASEEYCEEDYIRDYDEFLKYKHNND